MSKLSKLVDRFAPAASARAHGANALAIAAGSAAPRSADPGPWLRAFRRGTRQMLRTGLTVIVALGLVAAGLAAAVAVLTAQRPAVARAAPAPAADGWVEIVRPIALYDLAGTDYAKLPRVYRARRRLPDDAREDLLAFGGFGKPFLQLSLLRRGPVDPGNTPASFARDLDRLAEASDATISRIGRPAPAETRLGPLETADLLLRQGGSSMPCMGFRTAPQSGDVLRVTGVACAAPGHALGRAALACIVDRLDLLSAGDDTPLRAVFVAAERRGGSACAATGKPALASADRPAPSGRPPIDPPPSWLDPAAEPPPLRGRLIEAANRKR